MKLFLKGHLVQKIILIRKRTPPVRDVGVHQEVERSIPVHDSSQRLHD